MHTQLRGQVLKSDSLLLLAAFFWGTTFVAQRKAMDHIGPMTYNGFRFAIGGVSLLPIILWLRFRKNRTASIPWDMPKAIGCALAGAALFAAASFQQAGLIYTTAGKAGFITCLYVVIVPIIGLFLGHRYGMLVWAGAALAVVGLYLLSVTESLTIGRGDLLVLISAFFWAIHVLLIGHLATRANPISIACIQFFACSALSMLTAIIFEDIVFNKVLASTIPILYGGILSAGLAFTLQVVCQRTCPPAHAAVIMSMEMVFAALAGWIILHEILGLRQLIGCVFMLMGFLIVQLAPRHITKTNKSISSGESNESDNRSPTYT